MPPMLRRLIGSILLALALAGSQRVTLMAEPPLYVVCQLPDTSELLIVAQNFGGIGDAVKHCVKFWRGAPVGVTR
jgi:hypothetical protein